MNIYRVGLIASTALFAATLAACGQNDTPKAPAEPASAPATPQEQPNPDHNPQP